MTPEETRARLEKIYHERYPENYNPKVPAPHHAINNLLQAPQFLNYNRHLTPDQVDELLHVFNVFLMPLDGRPISNPQHKILGFLALVDYGEWIPARRFGKYWVNLHPGISKPARLCNDNIELFMDDMRRRGIVFGVVGEKLPKCEADDAVGCVEFTWPDDEDEGYYGEWGDDDCDEDEEDGDITSLYDDEILVHEEERMRLAVVRSQKESEDMFDRDMRAAIEASLKDKDGRSDNCKGQSDRNNMVCDNQSELMASKMEVEKLGEGWDLYIRLISDVARHGLETGHFPTVSVGDTLYAGESEGDLKTAVRVSQRLAEFEAWERKRATQQNRRIKKRREGTVPPAMSKSTTKREDTQVDACSINSIGSAATNEASSSMSDGDVQKDTVVISSSPTSSISV